MMSDQELHTFPNGVAVAKDDVARAAARWMDTFTHDMVWGKYAQEKPEVLHPAEALLLVTYAALDTTERTGGVPWGVYVMLGGDDGFAVAPTDPGLGHEDEWSEMTKAIYAQEILVGAARRGQRFVVSIASLWGGVEVSEDPTNLGGTKPLAEGKRPDLLVRFTATDVESGEVIRWWAKAAPTGVSERPLHLVPAARDHYDGEWAWRDALTEAMNMDDVVASIAVALPPGVELLGGVESPIVGQVDLRPGVYLPELVRTVEAGPVAMRRAMAVAADELNLNREQLHGVISNWMPRSFKRAADEGGDEFDNLPAGKGMKA